MFLKTYATEQVLAIAFGTTPKTFCKWNWVVIDAIASLTSLVRAPTETGSLFLSSCVLFFWFCLLFCLRIHLSHKIFQQINWEDRNIGWDGSTIYRVTVDGTDCRIQEPQPFSPKWYSHKFCGPGVRYEIVVAVNTGVIVSVNGPYCCGSWPDLKIARQSLVHKLDEGEFAVADGGYRDGYVKFLTPTGLHDPEDHSEAVFRARHETVNARLKKWNILRATFRHDVHKHGIVFRAIAHITQLELKTTQPLFHVELNG